MNWSKFVYHSLLTVILGVTLSVCSNVMETDDFEIEAIANSGSTKFGSQTFTSNSAQTISYDSSYTTMSVVNGTTYIVSAITCDNGTSYNQITHIDNSFSNTTKSGFTFDPPNSDAYVCGRTATLYYSVSGN